MADRNVSPTWATYAFPSMRSPTLKPAALRLDKPAGRAPAVLLGLFIVWQLVFIVTANLLEFFPHRVHQSDELTGLRELPPDAAKSRPAIHLLAAVTDRWAQLTGQCQMWSLFAPEFPPQATFPVVELCWDDPASGLAPVRLLSSFEPADAASYFRPLSSDDRLFHYEVYLGLGLCYWDESAATSETEAEAWRKHFRDVARRQWKSMRAYLRWRTAQFLKQHPDLPPPDEARLLIRIYPTPPPGAAPEDRSPPRDQPMARWRCAENGPPGLLPLEAYEPFSRRYVALPVRPGDELAGTRP
jgi:hypothetical protein